MGIPAHWEFRLMRLFVELFCTGLAFRKGIEDDIFLLGVLKAGSESLLQKQVEIATPAHVLAYI